MKAAPDTQRRVGLLFATTLAANEHQASLPGQAIRRLSTRCATLALTNLPTGDQNTALRQRACRLLTDALQGRLEGLVWLREDVVVDDYHLDQRLAEAWRTQDMVTLRDERQQVVLWAIGPRGLLRWKAGQPDPAGPALVAGMAAGVAPDSGFPSGECAWLQRQGLSDGPWPLAVSLAPLPLGGTVMATAGPDAPTAAPLKAWTATDTPPLLIACATRETAGRFETHTPTGRSLARLRSAGLRVRVEVATGNHAALAKTYNAAIRPELADHIVAFMHDDITIDDFYLPQQLHVALSQYDVVGAAGSRNRVANQPAWCFPAQLGEWDSPDNLLGTVAHQLSSKGTPKPPEVCRYGTPRGPARLLDGLLIAARVSTLLERGVRFDERFPFHFYDLDFCRSAESRGLRLGVWPLGVTHHSAGSGFGSRSWLSCWGRYIGKWGR